MKIPAKLLSLLGGASLLLATGCQKDTPAPTTPVVTGPITGYAQADDENGAPLDRSGITVTVDNSSPKLTTTTDAAGKFAFDNVPAGTYNLTFARTGLGTFRRLSVAHLGGPDPTFLPNVSLSQVSGTVVTALTSATPAANGNLLLQTSATNANPANQLRVAVFVAPAAGVTAATGTLLGVYAVTTTAAGTQGIAVRTADLRSAGIAAGATVYAVAYGAPVTNPGYVDPATGRTTYADLNPTASPALSFMAP